MSTNSNCNDNAHYNSDITIQETRGALSSLKDKTCPGPDKIHPIPIYNAKDVILKPLHILFHACWNEGTIPSVWRCENRIYIPKAGKSSYHTEKAYRSLSLSSCIGKILEKIICNRLVALLHERNIIDKDQYAYIKGRDINQALLNLTLDIQKSLKASQHTGCVMIDFEGAYDAVWRDGVMYKLVRLGIQGRMLNYIYSFLSERKTRSLVNSAVTPWIDTNVGIPQGSVIGPILYILFTHDITDYLSIPHIKYADDITIWHSGPNISDTEDCLSKNMDSLLMWAYKWRQIINLSKTESICFTKTGDIKLSVNVGPNYLNQVAEKRLLGVVFDNNLTFKPHIDLTTTKALGQLAKLSALTNGLRGATAEFMTMLYKCCIRPHLEFAYPIWCTTNDMKGLLKVQNQALRRCTGAMYGTPAAALEVITGVIPLDLRLDQILMSFFLRITSLSGSLLHEKIKILLNDSNFMDHRILTTLHKFKMVSRLLNKKHDLDNIEPSLNMKVENYISSKMSISNSNKQNAFGSSNKRTEEQKSKALSSAIGYISKTGEDIVAFTDGSALSNPGPCGAGAAVFWNGVRGVPSTYTRAISRRSSSYHGELQAIFLALEAIANKNPPVYNRRAHLITDCQSAVHAVTNCAVDGNYGLLLSKIQQCVNLLNTRKVEVCIFWTAGHINLPGNDIADSLAKEAAVNAATSDTSEPISHSEAKTIIKNLNCLRWQKRWDSCTTGRFTYDLYPSVKEGGYKTVCNRATEIKLIRLKTGTCLLNYHMNKVLPEIYTSANCECNTDRGTVHHFLFDCTLHNEQRTKLFHNIEKIFMKNDIPAKNSFIDLQVLLGQASHLPQAARSQINTSVANFVRATEVNI